MTSGLSGFLSAFSQPRPSPSPRVLASGSGFGRLLWVGWWWCLLGGMFSESGFSWLQDSKGDVVGDPSPAQSWAGGGRPGRKKEWRRVGRKIAMGMRFSESQFCFLNPPHFAFLLQPGPSVQNIVQSCLRTVCSPRVTLCSLLLTCIESSLRKLWPTLTSPRLGLLGRLSLLQPPKLHTHSTKASKWRLSLMFRLWRLVTGQPCVL